MKMSKGKIILVIIVVYFIVFGIINVNIEKKAHKEILDKVIIIKDGKVDKKNDNKIVLVVGKVDNNEPVSFLELDENFKTIKIKRTVEDYVKVKDEETNKVSYEWKERTKPLTNNDNDFLKEIVSEEKISDIKIGDFKLDDKGKELVPAHKYYSKQESIGELTTKGIAYERDPWEEDLQEGDIRLTYQYYELDKYPYLSVLAVQKGNSFIPYKIDKKRELYQVFEGKIDTKEKLAKSLKIKEKSTIRGKTLFIIMILGIGIFLIVDSKKK